MEKVCRVLKSEFYLVHLHHFLFVGLGEAKGSIVVIWRLDFHDDLNPDPLPLVMVLDVNLSLTLTLRLSSMMMSHLFGTRDRGL